MGRINVTIRIFAGAFGLPTSSCVVYYSAAPISRAPRQLRSSPNRYYRCVEVHVAQASVTVLAQDHCYSDLLSILVTVQISNQALRGLLPIALQHDWSMLCAVEDAMKGNVHEQRRSCDVPLAKSPRLNCRAAFHTPV